METIHIKFWKYSFGSIKDVSEIIGYEDDDEGIQVRT